MTRKHETKTNAEYMLTYVLQGAQEQTTAPWARLPRTSHAALKGTVQRTLTGVETDINRKLFLSH